MPGAAEQGRPGAQFYLALLYEKGQGVPRDFARALHWYSRSASNGVGQAAMFLGNFYTDGLDVKPDSLEGFVWYSVAAAQGDKVAEALRKSLLRKLTFQEIAEGRKRIESILARRPSRAANAAPELDSSNSTP